MQFPIQVRYSDFDMMGHLNNAAYATYFEVARLNFLMKVFKDNSIQWTDVVASLSVDYRIPILPDHNPGIEIYCSRIGNKSYDLDYILFEKDNPEIRYAEGKTIQVRVDSEKHTPIALSDEIKKVLTSEMPKK